MDGVTTVTDRGVPPDVTWWRAADGYAHAFRDDDTFRSLCRREMWMSQQDTLAVRCPDCALLADGAPGEITEAYGK